MTVGPTTIDLDDGDSLLSADTDGLLRAAAMAGAQVRATAAAVEEGALEPLRGAGQARTVIWVGGRATAATAGTLLAAALGGAAAQPIVPAGEVPPWIGPLDVLIVAGDDPGDPALVTAAATGVRRGARVAVVAPYEGPLRDATAGRAAVLAPRIRVPDAFRLSGYLAAGLAVLQAVDPRLPADLAGLADALDAEALHSSAGRDVFTNPAKTLAGRMAGGGVTLAGDDAATLALARHGSAALLRIGHTVVAATGLADAVAALRDGAGPADSIFYDEQIDGPRSVRLHVLALTLADQRTVTAARIAGLSDVDLVAAGDVATVGEAGAEGGVAGPPSSASIEQQLAVLAVRLEMAAVYLRLARG